MFHDKYTSLCYLVDVLRRLGETSRRFEKILGETASCSKRQEYWRIRLWTHQLSSVFCYWCAAIRFRYAWRLIRKSILDVELILLTYWHYMLCNKWHWERAASWRLQWSRICTKILIMTILVVATLFDDDSVHHIHFSNWQTAFVAYRKGETYLQTPKHALHIQQYISLERWFQC